MLIALVGVNVIVFLRFVVFVLTRKRWVKRQTGALRGVIRVAGGAIDGLRPGWQRGYGRWIRDVLVWAKGPFLFRMELVADGLGERRPAEPGEANGLGDRRIVIRVRADPATVEVAAADNGDAEFSLGPHRAHVDATVGPASAVTARAAREEHRTRKCRRRV